MQEILRDNIVIMLLDEFLNSQYPLPKNKIFVTTMVTLFLWNKVELILLIYLLVIELSVLLFTASDYPFGSSNSS
jgi:hypothetical protein